MLLPYTTMELLFQTVSALWMALFAAFPDQKHLQRVMYNGHKRVHAMKFQSVVLPNGIIANLAGPYEGRRHDSTMLQQSGLLTSLRRVAHFNGQPLCLYGDPAYPSGVHLQAPFQGRVLTPEMQA